MTKKFQFISIIFSILILTCFASCKNPVEESHEHTFEEAWTYDSTYHWHKSICQHDEEVVSDKAEHNFGEWTVTKEPTEEEQGSKSRSCTVCGYEETDVVAKLEHTHTFESEWTSDAESHWHKATCGHEEKNDVAAHTWGAWTIVTVPTSTAKGLKKRTCSVCHYVDEKQTELCANHTLDNGTVTIQPTILEPGEKEYKCAECGAFIKTEILPRLFCESPLALDLTTPTSATTEVYFGDFPRTVVKQSADGTVLYGKDKTTPITISETDDNKVTQGSNTYYLGSDGEYYCKCAENWCNETDFEDEQKLYYSDNSEIKKEEDHSTRWFLVEPIKWKVFTNSYSLDYENTTNPETAFLLVAEEILNAGIPYYLSQNVRYVGANDTTIKPNNYQYSQIRAYLTGSVYYNDSSVTVSTYNNKGFLQTAFTGSAQNKIKTTKVNNTAETTGYSQESYATESACGPTEDKIFLLSVSEVINSEYGMPAYNAFLNAEDENRNDGTRIRKATDYAMANYAYQYRDNTYGGEWMLRSPHKSGDPCVHGVASDGFVDDPGDEYLLRVDYPSNGIVPALCISLP